LGDIDIVAGAIRTVESDGDYNHQRLTSIGGERHRQVGAYGFVDKRWVELAAAAGYPGANWRDPTAQDRIAKAKLQRDFDKYGDWEAVAIAFRFGGATAKAYKDGRGFAQREEVEGYARKVRKLIPDTERRITGSMTPQTEQRQNHTLTRAESVIRDQLVTMRDAQRKGAPDGSNENIIEGGNQGMANQAQ